MLKKEFPIKYKKDLAMQMRFEQFFAFLNQYKLKPDVIVKEYECLTGKKVTKTQLNKVIIKKINDE